MTAKQFGQVIFHKDTILLVGALVFLWMGIGLIVDINMKKADLVPHTGQLVEIDSAIIKKVNKLFYKEVRKEIYLKLDNETGYFTSRTDKNFGDIISKIRTGDTITIYTKPKAWGIFGLKKVNDISQLEKAGMVIIDFETYRNSMSGITWLPLVAGFVFLVVYAIRVKRRYGMHIAILPRPE